MLELHKILAQHEIPSKYYILKLEKLLGSTSGKAVSPNRLFADVGDDFWLWLNTEGYRQNAALQEILPGLPDEGVQLRSNGIAGDRALVDGFMIYQWIKEIFESYAGDLAACSNVLDFGCGWGRVIRFFLKDLEPSKLWGIDHYDKVIEICKRTNKWCNFNLINPFPPTSFSENTFDLVFCYSVFSHLSEDAHQKWLVEFSRIMKPGGILIATTWERDFIMRCNQLRGKKDLPFFQEYLPTMFQNTEQSLADYDSGRFCFDTSVESYGVVSSFLGEACIPKDYVLEHWTKCFTFLDFIEDRKMCSQNVIVMRKPFGNGSPTLHSNLDHQDFLRQQQELVRLEAESGRLQRELAKQQAELVQVQQEAMKRRAELDRVQGNLGSVQDRLTWTQDQLQRMRATRLWHLGTLYWRAHAWLAARLRGS
jgi:ubiquinone/menaquinone biosynthesis C-methylase UbiE